VRKSRGRGGRRHAEWRGEEFITFVETAQDSRWSEANRSVTSSGSKQISQDTANCIAEKDWLALMIFLFVSFHCCFPTRHLQLDCLRPAIGCNRAICPIACSFTMAFRSQATNVLANVRSRLVEACCSAGSWKANKSEIHVGSARSLASY
jgi:hypothetical protein